MTPTSDSLGEPRDACTSSPSGSCATRTRRRTRCSDNWIGIYDPSSGVTLTSLDPFTGTATLPADTDRQYESAVQLPDGRVVLIGGEEPDVVIGGRNPVDIFR